jgi:alanyl-tRNA synthetase
MYKAQIGCYSVANGSAAVAEGQRLDFTRRCDNAIVRRFDAGVRWAVPTERLYYTDGYLTQFDARTVSLSEDGLRVVLDRTAFYPTSGGQLFDLGTLGGTRVVEVIDEGETVAHVLATPIGVGPVHGEIDWARRFEFMQQHTGQHLLSAVFQELFGFATASVHLGEEGGTVELAVGSVSGTQAREAEILANRFIVENRGVSISFEESPEGLRKAPERTGALRIVSIEGLDKSACGGTHVSRTGEIGSLSIRKAEKIRGNTRLEFVCGFKAVRRARMDFELLTAAGRAFSRPLEEVPAAVVAMQEASRTDSKLVRSLALELAGYRGRSLFDAAVTGADGVRRHWLRLDAVDESTRAVAQSFVGCGSGVLLATGGGAVLVAASADAGVHCGNLLKQFGRGGGSALLAQGSLTEAGLLAEALGIF